MRTIHFTEKDGVTLFKATDISEVFAAEVEEFEPNYVTAERMGQMIRSGHISDGEEMTVRFVKVV